MVTKHDLHSHRMQESRSTRVPRSAAKVLLSPVAEQIETIGEKGNKMRRLILIGATVALVMAAAGALVAKEIAVQGRLQKTVEPGGWLISADKEKYLILNARNFQKQAWFKESAAVEAVGEAKPDVVTTYMEGTPFEVTSMHPVGQKQAAADTVVADARRVTRVMVAGDSIVQAHPDTAILIISVVTQGK